MSEPRTRGEIDTSRIPVDGVGGLGLLAMAGVLAYFVEPLRMVGVIALIGGIAIALVRLARHKEIRPQALTLLCVMAAMLVVVLVRYGWPPHW